MSYGQKPSPSNQQSNYERKVDLGIYIQYDVLPAINKAIEEGKRALYYDKIEQFDITFDPYHDKKYEADMDALRKMRKEAQLRAKTPEEAEEIKYTFYKGWQRTLMHLAARNNFLPHRHGTIELGRAWHKPAEVAVA